MGNTKDAYDLFDKSYELYCMFWGLNMKLIGTENLEWIKDTGIDVKEIEKHVANFNNNVKNQPDKKDDEKKSKVGKLKEIVKKAVNCCIE